MKKIICLTVVLILLLIIAQQPTTAQHVYHEVRIQAEGEYKIRSIGNGNIYTVEGTGKIDIESKLIIKPEETKRLWWELF